jgi:hypothetical protein
MTMQFAMAMSLPGIECNFRQSAERLFIMPRLVGEANNQLRGRDEKSLQKRSMLPPCDRRENAKNEFARLLPGRHEPTNRHQHFAISFHCRDDIFERSMAERHSLIVRKEFSMQLTRLSRISLGLLAASCLLVSTNVASFADAWPSRSIKLIVPFPAGGAADTVARVYADKLAAAL